MRRRLTVIVLAVAFGFGLVGSASAAPVTCPPPQIAVHDGDGWHCENGGGNYSGADETKNPND
jgi:hypothetical protein